MSTSTLSNPIDPVTQTSRAASKVVVSAAEMTIAAIFESALEHHRAGRLAEAERMYRQVLSVETNHAGAAFLLGLVALGSGRVLEAVEALRQATRLDPENGVYEANLGEAYRRLRRFPEAAQSLAKAMYLRPDLAEPVFNMGLILQELGELEASVSCFERAAEAKSDNSAIVQRWEQARGAFLLGQHAVDCAPSPASDQVVIRALLALADVNRTLGRRPQVVSLCRRALGYGPRFVPALVHLAEALANSGQTDEAVVRFRQALEIEPGNEEAMARLVEVLHATDRVGEAVDLLRECLEVQNHPLLRSLLLMTLSYVPGHTDRAILEEARVWDREHGAALAPKIETWANDKSPERRLRIGYVSPSFKDHVHVYFLPQLLQNHDRKAFELFLYSDVRQPGAETERYRSCADTWRETSTLSDEAMAERIRADRIDILVDLTMHTDQHRLLVFARKPAPIEVCWLAYPGTTGLSAMDYRVTDRHLDPPGGDRSVYAERSLVLPDTFWCYSPRTSKPQPAPLPALNRGYVTFSCLNNYVKVNQPLLQVWSRILREVERSRLVLLAPSGDIPRRTLALFEQNGVDPSRISFVDRRAREEYLALYRDFDLCLDTFPYAGHTTSLDAFWMGVPVLTLAGSTVVGRAGVCFAMNLGLSELIASSEDDYIRMAIGLAGDLPRLAALREGLRQRMEASPLMDGPRFARNMEDQYRQIWRAFCAQWVR